MTKSQTRDRPLPWFEEGQQNSCGGKVGLRVNLARARSWIVVLAFFAAAATGSDCIAQSLSSPGPQEVLEAIKIDVAGDVQPVPAAVDRLDEFSTQRSGGGVELLSLVSDKRDAVPSHDSHKERERVQQDRVGGSDGLKEWLQWAASPFMWLVLGLIVGGAFERPRRR